MHVIAVLGKRIRVLTGRYCSNDEKAPLLQGFEWTLFRKMAIFLRVSTIECYHLVPKVPLVAAAKAISICLQRPCRLIFRRILCRRGFWRSNRRFQGWHGRLSFWKRLFSRLTKRFQGVRKWRIQSHPDKFVQSTCQVKLFGIAPARPLR